MKPLVSIIIPHSWDRVLLPCLLSIKQQTYQELEIIIKVDNKQQGPGNPRNEGARAAQGKYLFFCDDDIELEPTCIGKMVDTLEANPQAAFAYCDYSKSGSMSGVHQGKPWDPEAIRRLNYISTMSLVRRENFLGFDETLQRYVDWDLWIRYAIIKQTGVYIPEILFNANFGNDGISTRGPRDRLLNSVSLKQKYGIKERTYSIIVCVHNQLFYTKNCLNSLIRNTSEDFEIIVVNDQSTDGTREYLESLGQLITPVHTLERTHHSKSCNQGAQIARGDYLIFLNNDTLVPLGWNTRLRETFDQVDKISCVGPLTSHSASCQELLRFKNMIEDINIHNIQTVQEMVEIDYHPRAVNAKITGFCLLTSKEVWKKIGPLCEDIPAGGNEADWILRGAGEGLFPYISTAGYVHHYGNKSYQKHKEDLWEKGRKVVLSRHGNTLLQWLEETMYLKQYPQFEKSITRRSR